MKEFGNELDLSFDREAGYWDDTISCTWCGGTGEIRQAVGYPKECRWCHGTGRLDPDSETKPPKPKQP